MKDLIKALLILVLVGSCASLAYALGHEDGRVQGWRRGVELFENQECWPKR